MMIQMKRFFILCTILCISFASFAKSPIKGLPKDCKVYKPIYSTQQSTAERLEFFAGKGYGQVASNKDRQYWDAYSDRADNTTYLSTSTSKPFSSLGFREKVRIARIKNDFALVYIPNDEATDVFPVIPEDAQWKGWVPMSTLVYYDKSIISDEGIYNTILLKDNVEFSSHLKLSYKLYETPSDEESGAELPNSNNSIFYQIKKEGGYILLATQPDLTDSANIYGWIKTEHTLFWDSRMALEPTWSVSDRSYFAKEGKTCTIEDSQDSRIGIVSLSVPAGSTALNDDLYRMHDDAWRFPILGKMQDEFYTCAIPGQSSALIAPSQRVAVVSGSSSSYNPNNPLVNIYFIVDGSRLYEPFFPILAERIKALGTPDMESGIRVGMTIYHDSRNGSFMSESHPLTFPDDQSLYDFIDQGGQYGFRDNLSEAPILSVLNDSMSNAGFESDAKKYIVIIGGRGDNSDSFSPSEIGTKCAHNGISVFGLQVQNNPAVSAYRTYTYLIEDILESSLKRKLDGPIVKSKNRESNEPVQLTTYKPRDYEASLYESVASIESGLMSEDVFSSELDKIIQRIAESASSLAGLSSVYPDFFRFARIRESGGERLFFKDVALFSEEDIDALLKFFGFFDDQYSLKFPSRQSIVDMFMNTVINDESSSDAMRERETNVIKSMGYNEIIVKIAKLRPYHSYYRGRTLKELSGQQMVSNEELRFILSKLSHHYKRLLEIKQTPSIYRTVINSSSYYWVPLEDLL